MQPVNARQFFAEVTRNCVITDPSSQRYIAFMYVEASLLLVIMLVRVPPYILISYKYGGGPMPGISHLTASMFRF
jgi:hypothetical protein